MVQAANLRAKSLGFVIDSVDHLCTKSIPFDEQYWKEIAEEAQKLDIALTSWSQNLPEDWKFFTHAAPPITNSPETDLFYNGPTHLYQTHAHAAVWNRYRATRLIVNSIRKRALSHLLTCPCHGDLIVSQQELCQKNLDLITNDMCGSVPFFFNLPNFAGGTPGLKSIRLGTFIINSEDDILPKMAILLAWPLTVAVSTDGVPEPQRQWLRHRLKIAAKSLGDSVLESVAERSEFRF